MSHRPGHTEETGEECCSMDRRKYLSTLAAGAAFGAVAVGAAACGGGGTESTSTGDTATTPSDTTMGGIKSMAPAPTDPVGDVTKRKLWGYLRVFPSDVIRIADAKTSQIEQIETIRIPYFNNTGLDLTANPIFGFNLLRIGCPAKFVIAINLTIDDDDAHHPTDPKITKARNDQMDTDLKAMGYKLEPWKGVDTVDCP